MYLYDENYDDEAKYTSRFAAGVAAAGHSAKIIGDNTVLVDIKYVFSVKREDDDCAVVSPSTNSNRDAHISLLNSLARSGKYFEPRYAFYDGFLMEATMTEREKVDYVIHYLTRLGHTVYEMSGELVVDGSVIFKLNVFNDSIQLLPADTTLSCKHRRIYRDLNVLR